MLVDELPEEVAGAQGAIGPDFVEGNQIDTSGRHRVRDHVRLGQRVDGGGRRQWDVHGGERLDRPRGTRFGNLEIFCGEAGDRPAVGIDDQRVDLDQRHARSKGRRLVLFRPACVVLRCRGAAAADAAALPAGNNARKTSASAASALGFDEQGGGEEEHEGCDGTGGEAMRHLCVNRRPGCRDDTAVEAGPAIVSRMRMQCTAQ